MNKTTRTAVLLLTLGLIAIGMVVLFRPATDRRPVRLGSFSVAVDYSAYLVAKNKGWYKEELGTAGLEPEFTVFQTMPPINESFGADRVDVVFEAEPPAIAGRAAGIDIKIVGVSCSVPVEVLVPTASKILELSDLRGKKIAVLAGTSSHYGLIKILRSAGVLPTEVEIVDMTPPDAKGAFRSGSIDAWAVWSPWIEQEELGETGRTLPGKDAVVYSIMTADGDFARRNPEMLKKAVSILNRARKWVVENPAEAQEIAAKELGVDLSVVKKAWPRHDWSVELDDEALADLQSKADFLYENKFIRKKVSVRDDMLDLSFSK
jgi:sulfonate transport system substrate-binding protein